MILPPVDEGQGGGRDGSAARPSDTLQTSPAASRRWSVVSRRRLAARLLVGGVLTLGAVLLGSCGVAERLFYMPTRGTTPPPTWLNPAAEAFWIESADGTRLRAWFIPGQPSGPTRDPALDRPGGAMTSLDSGAAAATLPPTVVHLHGNAGNMLHHLSFTEHLARAGMNLVLVDYRGYGESDGAARDRADLIADAIATITAVAARDDVDASRIGVYGHSLGGAIAVSAMSSLEAAARGGDKTGVKVRALVLESPFASWRDVAASALGGDPPAAPARWLAAWLIPDTDRPVDAATTLSVPTLIVHGDRDRVVPVSHGRRLAEALPNAELVVLPGGDHNTLLDTHPQVAEVVRSFLLANLANP